MSVKTTKSSAWAGFSIVGFYLAVMAAAYVQHYVMA